MDKNNKRLGIIAFILVGIVIVLGFISLIVSNPIIKIISNVFIGYHFNDYDNDDVIINSDTGNFSGFSGRSINSGNGYAADVKKCSGIQFLLDADISSERDIVFHIKLKSDRGKAKIVLVNSNTQKVTILKEVERDKENSYEGDVKVHCFPGKNKLKIVTDDFSGSFEASETESDLFKYKIENMFDDKFPFGNKA